jgi:hypothetical protein
MLSQHHSKLLGLFLAFVFVLILIFCLFLETGSCYVAQGGIELNPASVSPNAGITGMHFHIWPDLFFII